jgi:hypothetical protein
MPSRVPPDAIGKTTGDEDARRAAFLRRLDELSRPGPAGFEFDRDEIYRARLNRLKVDASTAKQARSKLGKRPRPNEGI